MAASDQVPMAGPETQKLLDGVAALAKGYVGYKEEMELRGVILHKLIILIQTKGTRKVLVNFLISLLNLGIYPIVKRLSRRSHRLPHIAS